eukprot:4654427-Amphidinium_carterae.2
MALLRPRTEEHQTHENTSIRPWLVQGVRVALTSSWHRRTFAPQAHRDHQHEEASQWRQRG